MRTYGSRSTNKGDVQFEVKDFYGTKRIYVQNNFRLDSTYHIQVLNPFSEQYIAWPLPPGRDAFEHRQAIARSRSVSMRGTGYYRRPGKPVCSPSTRLVSSSAVLRTSPQYLDDYTVPWIMEEVLREYVPGVRKSERRKMDFTSW